MPSISILIVEDEVVTAMYIETMLKRKGYDILKCVASGEEAVDFAVKFKPDIVIMDIRLAGKMDGIEAAERIKAESASPTGLIFASGYSDQDLMDRAMGLDPISFLMKPINFTQLVNLIEGHFTA